MQNSMVISTFFVLTGIFFFFFFFFAKFVPKGHNCQFKLRFGTQINSDMQNSVVVFTFYLDWSCPSKLKFIIYNLGFSPEIPFLSKFGPKSQNCLFKVKFGTQTSQNMQNSMMLLTFSGLTWEYLFWEVCFKKSILFIEAKIQNLQPFEKYIQNLIGFKENIALK